MQKLWLAVPGLALPPSQLVRDRLLLGSWYGAQDFWWWFWSRYCNFIIQLSKCVASCLFFLLFFFLALRALKNMFGLVLLQYRLLYFMSSCAYYYFVCQFKIYGHMSLLSQFVKNKIKNLWCFLYLHTFGWYCYNVPCSRMCIYWHVSKDLCNKRSFLI